MARMPAFDRAISVVLRGAEEECRKALVDVIHDELDRVHRESRPSTTSQSVDGVPGKAVEDIEPFGHAAFRFGYHVEIVAFALDLLRAISPVDSGGYKHSHNVFIDGVRVDDFRSIPPGSGIVIASTLPYARRLELPTKWRSGPNKGQPRGFSIQTQVPQPPTSIYRHAAETLARRYGNVMTAAYLWVEADGMRVPAISLVERVSV